MFKTKKIFVVLVLLVLAGGVAYGFLGIRKPQADKAAGPAPVPVLTATAVARDMPVAIDMVGRAEAYESVTLKSRVDGQVAAVPFTEGQHVKKGDVLVRLDQADFIARLRQAEATLARDEAQLAKARNDVSRYVALKERGFVSEEKVSEVRTNAEAFAATVRADKAALDLARLQLDYTTVRAPFEGVIGARLVFPGTVVKTNDTALAVVNRVRPLYVSFSVPEKYLPPLREAMRGGPLKVAVGVTGGNGRQLEGEARFLDNSVDAATGTIQMKAVLPNDREVLIPGQFVNVNLVLGTLKDAVTVPSEALQQGPEGSFVFVVKSDGTAESRKVKPGPVRGGVAVIENGIVTGETIVTDGQLRLVPGVRVEAKSRS